MPWVGIKHVRFVLCQDGFTALQRCDPSVQASSIHVFLEACKRQAMLELVLLISDFTDLLYQKQSKRVALRFVLDKHGYLALPVLHKHKSNGFADHFAGRVQDIGVWEWI